MSTGPWVGSGDGGTTIDMVTAGRPSGAAAFHRECRGGKGIIAKGQAVAWAAAHMECKTPGSIYPVWETQWHDGRGCCGVEYALRLCENDIGVDIVIAACPASYAGNEAMWHGINFGPAESLEQIEGIYNWIERQTHKGKAT